MKNDQYAALKRHAARVYQARSETIAFMNKTPAEKRDDEWKARRARVIEPMSAVNRSKGEEVFEKGRFVGRADQGLLSSLHELVTRRDPGYIIPSMSCLKRDEKWR